MAFLTFTQCSSSNSERRTVKTDVTLGILKAFQYASAVSVSPAMEFWNII
jgi:hypothetical protein